MYSAGSDGQVRKMTLENVAMETLHSILHSTYPARQNLEDGVEIDDDKDDLYTDLKFVYAVYL